MEIINVIETVDNVPLSLTSFATLDDQLISEVVGQAEDLLIKQAKENGLIDDDDAIEAVISDGHYTNGNYHVTIIWSSIDA